MKATLFSVLFLLSFQALAGEKYLFFMGAGGEPEGKSTIFDSNIKSMAKFSKESGWKTTISINGGHTETEQIISSKFSHAKNLGKFNEAGFNSMLDEISKKLLQDVIKSGDKILLAIETHGARRLSTQKTHSIALAGKGALNLETLEGASTASLDQIEEIIELAEKKNVQIAVLDLTCYSGNTIRLATPKTCVMSSTGTDHPGYTAGWKLNVFRLKKENTDFPGILLTSLETGKNLEELFLKSRVQSIAPDFPVISTEAGKINNKFLYDLILPMLVHEVRLNGFTRQYGKNFESFSSKVLEIKEKLEIMQGFLESLSLPENGNIPTGAFRNALTAYRAYQEAYETKLESIYTVANLAKSDIETKYPQDKSLFLREDGLAILNAEYEKDIQYFDKEIQHYRTTPPTYLNAGAVQIVIKNKEADRARFVRKKEIQSELLKLYGSRLEFEKKKLETTYTESELTKTHALSEAVRKEAQKIYLKLYHHNAGPEANPCREFTL